MTTTTPTARLFTAHVHTGILHFSAAERATDAADAISKFLGRGYGFSEPRVCEIHPDGTKTYHAVATE